jgi:hypothetical protein
MEKVLKDNLKDFIKIGTDKCYSISEVLNIDYDRFKIQKEGYGLATYKGKILVLDIESEKLFDNMNIDFSENEYKELESLYSNIYNQVSQINEMLDIEV